MSTIKLLPYSRYSKSAKALARELGVLRVVSEGYRQRRREWIVNWGTSSPTQSLLPWQVLNRPEAVAKASNKLTTMRELSARGVALPEWTTQRQEAARWLTEGYRAVCRTLLSSHSGNGAIVAERPLELVEAPLYTRYFRRDAEFRVHVFQGRVIDFIHKKRREGHEQDPHFNPYLRTHQHGWVFCRDGVALPEPVRLASIQAVQGLGLDFGAVDILWRLQGERVAVLEVNTAPGLEGTTLQRYAEAIRALTMHRVM